MHHVQARLPPFDASFRNPFTVGKKCAFLIGRLSTLNRSRLKTGMLMTMF